MERDKMIRELKSQTADDAAVFNMMGKISSCTNTGDVIDQVKDLFVRVFGAQTFTFWNETNEPTPVEVRELTTKNARFAYFIDEKRFCIKVLWEDQLFGILDVSDFLFPDYIERYLGLALEIARFLGLVFHNHDQYNAIVRSHLEAEAKSRYFAHMNHEIRTPLNGFMGFLQLMDSTNLDQEQQEYMHHMKQTTKYMLNIINNVLDIAKIDAGEMTLSNRDVDLKEEFETALAPLRSLARRKNIELTTTIEENLPQKAEGDPDRLGQILLNLGGNAVKFTREGQVCIVIKCLETTGTQHRLQIQVEDTGPGMTPATLEKLFLPFYQKDDGTVPQSKGTGLGMAITKELVELMEGDIQVDSTPGKGTRVKVSLMVNRARDGKNIHVPELKAEGNI